MNRNAGLLTLSVYTSYKRLTPLPTACSDFAIADANAWSGKLGKVILEGRLPEGLKAKGRGIGGEIFTFRITLAPPSFHSRTALTDAGVGALADGAATDECGRRWWRTRETVS